VTERRERAGFYPGTFDPVTHGHMDIIARAARVLDRVVIGVADNPAKAPLLSMAERMACLDAAVASVRADSGAVIEVVSFDCLLVDAVRQHGASVIVRGLRAVSDFDYESQMTGLNRKLAPELETIFLMAAEHRRCIASRMVKEIARLGGDITPFVPDLARQTVLARLGRA